MFKKEGNSVNNNELEEEAVHIDIDSEEETKKDEGDETVTEAAAESSEEAIQETSTEEVEKEDKADKKKKDKKEKKEKKDKRDEQIKELQDRVLRQQAEFVNFRNRTEKEKGQMFDVGAKSILEKILPVLDNFERGLSILSEEQKQEPFAQGIDKVYKQLVQTLQEAGVTAIEAVGNEFDPNLHNAVMHVEDDSVGENIVVEEFQKGYRYHDVVVRHSMVKVAN